jgi:hypothetical protein
MVLGNYPGKWGWLQAHPMSPNDQMQKPVAKSFGYAEYFYRC